MKYWRSLLADLASVILRRLGYRWFGGRLGQREMQHLLDGYRASALIHVAAKLGIADLLAKGPLSSRDLARSVGADAVSMHRFLRGLAAFGICREEPDGRFGITGLGTWLQERKPGSMRGQVIRCGEVYTAWGSLLHSVMTGETAFRHVFGDDVWNHRRKDPDLDESFNRAFVQDALRIGREVLSVCDFSPVRTIADIGGGYGALLAAILRASPSLTGLLLDQPHVIAKAPSYLKEAGVLERCRTFEGDFFTHVPDGADLYILKSVLHDWDDGRSERILKNCRRAMKEGARLIVIERIMPDRVKQDPRIVLLDLRMLATTGGRERSAAEYRALFEAAGLTLTRIIPLRSGFNVIEGVPALGKSP